jgi:hypothetical protein
MNPGFSFSYAKMISGGIGPSYSRFVIEIMAMALRASMFSGRNDRALLKLCATSARIPKTHPKKIASAIITSRMVKAFLRRG